jgi:hypothetical protein
MAPMAHIITPVVINFVLSLSGLKVVTIPAAAVSIKHIIVGNEGLPGTIVFTLLEKSLINNSSTPVCTLRRYEKNNVPIISIIKRDKIDKAIYDLSISPSSVLAMKYREIPLKLNVNAVLNFMDIQAGEMLLNRLISNTQPAITITPVIDTKNAMDFDVFLLFSVCNEGLRHTPPR